MFVQYQMSGLQYRRRIFHKLPNCYRYRTRSCGPIHTSDTDIAFVQADEGFRMLHQVTIMVACRLPFRKSSGIPKCPVLSTTLAYPCRDLAHFFDSVVVRAVRIRHPTHRITHDTFQISPIFHDFVRFARSGASDRRMSQRMCRHLVTCIERFDLICTPCHAFRAVRN